MTAGILEILLGFWASQRYLSVKGALTAPFRVRGAGGMCGAVPRQGRRTRGGLVSTATVPV